MAAGSSLHPALQSPVRWPSEAIWQAVEPSLPGFTVEVLPEIDSSNSELMRRFRGSPGIAPQAEPVLLVAEQQTAGRGRQGRSWQSRRGASLSFSLGMALNPSDWSGLSLVVGISLAESLDPKAAHIGLKWPNDLWMPHRQGQPAAATHRKLGGILVETAHRDGQRYVVVGVGLNIEPTTLPAAAEPSAATLPIASAAAAVPAGCLQELDPAADAASSLLQVVPALVHNILAFERFGFAAFQSRFAQRDVLAGREVQVLGGPDTAVRGSAHGVGENGALLVHTPAGMKAITSSEISIRPITAGLGTASC